MLKWKTGLLCGYPLLKWLLKSMVLDVLHSLRCSSTKLEPRSALPGEQGLMLCQDGGKFQLQQRLWLQDSSWDSYKQLTSAQG